jgi:hypothetical protein
VAIEDELQLLLNQQLVLVSQNLFLGLEKALVKQILEVVFVMLMIEMMKAELLLAFVH